MKLIIAPKIIQILSSARLPLQHEKETQNHIAEILSKNGIIYKREYRLSSRHVPDFFIDGICIEIKIKDRKMDIYRQCRGYCEFEEVKSLILVTNQSMGFPQEINKKPCYVIKPGKAWL